MPNQISPMAFVHPDAKLGDNNIIGPFCYIDADVVIGDSNVMQNSVTLNQGTRMGSGNEIFPGTSISTKPQDLKYRGETTTCQIGDNNSIRENVTISRGTASKGTTIVGSNNLLMENMHIAHDCIIGNNCIIGNSTKFAGEVVVDDCAIISAEVLFHHFCQSVDLSEMSKKRERKSSSLKRSVRYSCSSLMERFCLLHKIMSLMHWRIQ